MRFLDGRCHSKVDSACADLHAQIECFVLLSGLDHPLYPTGKSSSALGTEEFIRFDRVLNPDGAECLDRYAHRVLLSDNRWHNPQECSRTVDWLARRTSYEVLYSGAELVGFDQVCHELHAAGRAHAAYGDQVVPANAQPR